MTERNCKSKFLCFIFYISKKKIRLHISVPHKSSNKTSYNKVDLLKICKTRCGVIKGKQYLAIHCLSAADLRALPPCIC